MSEPVILICVRALPGDDPELVRGSSRDHCKNCGHPIWVAPSGRLIVANEGALLLCTDCGVAALESDPDPKLAVSKAQVTELREHIQRKEN